MIPPRVSISAAELAAFCRRHHIRRLALFGPVLRDDFRSESDIDVLVEFAPGHTPGFSFITIQDELSALLGGREIQAIQAAQQRTLIIRDQARVGMVVQGDVGGDRTVGPTVLGDQYNAGRDIRRAADAGKPATDEPSPTA